MCRVHIAPDAVGFKYLAATIYRFDTETDKWVADRDTQTIFNYQPVEDEAIAIVKEDGFYPESMRSRWIDFRIDVTCRRFVLWIDGMAAQVVNMPPEQRGKCSCNWEMRIVFVR